MPFNYTETIWLIGDGRSGTTWVSNLINHDKQYREMFEPFHPMFIPEVNFVLPHQYIRPDALTDKFKNILSDVLTGKLYHQRIDQEPPSKQQTRLLIKDIFVNLLSYSAFLQFPHVKIVLLIRNPFAMALSKYKKRNWCWVTEPLHLLNQKDLYADYLQPFEDVIRQTSARKNYILNQVLIWAIIHYIPLRQFNPSDIHLCFYEKVYANPDKEISQLFQFVRGTDSSVEVELDKNLVKKPSRILGSDVNLLSGSSPITSWQDELPQQIIDDGLEILQHFGFANAYDKHSIPDSDVFATHQKA